MGCRGNVKGTRHAPLPTIGPLSDDIVAIGACPRAVPAGWAPAALLGKHA
jgi:hypothetical protein